MLLIVSIFLLFSVIDGTGLTLPVLIFIFYVLVSLELIAEEIEDPFGGDDNDVPTDKIAQNIHNHIAEIL